MWGDPQRLLAATWAIFTVMPWAVYLVAPKQKLPKFVGKQLAHLADRVALACVLHWGGFW